MPELLRTTTLPGHTAQALWDWHAAPGAFNRLVPPWTRLRLEGPAPALEDGTEAHLRLGLGPLSWAWTARHRDCHPGQGFIDEAVRGPFTRWVHEHSFRDDAGGAVLQDRIDYQLPAGPLGQLVAGGFVRRELDRTFTWRHHRTRDDLDRHRGVRPQTVAVTGATGLVGQALCTFLTTGGHRVVPLVRRQARQGEIAWDPAKGTLDPEDLRSIDAVIHLAGENVAQPWTAAARARIRDSRVQGTSLLAQAIARCSVPPKVLVSCSAIGLYGHEPAQVDESSPIGAGFLAEVVAAWEGAADPAREAGVRVVHPRVGIVQSLRGGALAKQLPAFQLGLGGPIGGGAQGVSWVGLDDLVDLLYLAMHDERLDGPFNAVSPNPVDQRTYARTLGQALGRPAVLPVPAFALRAVLGEMADEMLLGGAFVHPRRLEALGFTWRHPTLSQALASELGHPEVPHGT